MPSNQFFYPSSYAQTQGQATGTGSTSEAIEANANAMGMIPGGFGTGFKVGYTAGNVLTGPFLSYRAAKQEKRSLQMQADIANLQSASYHTAADDAKRAGLNQAAAIGYQAGQAKSSAKVKQAASGVRVGGSGSQTPWRSHGVIAALLWTIQTRLFLMSVLPTVSLLGPQLLRLLLVHSPLWPVLRKRIRQTALPTGRTLLRSVRESVRSLAADPETLSEAWGTTAVFQPHFPIRGSKWQE